MGDRPKPFLTTLYAPGQSRGNQLKPQRHYRRTIWHSIIRRRDWQQSSAYRQLSFPNKAKSGDHPRYVWHWWMRDVITAALLQILTHSLITCHFLFQLRHNRLPRFNLLLAKTYAYSFIILGHILGLKDDYLATQLRSWRLSVYLSAGSRQCFKA